MHERFDKKPLKDMAQAINAELTASYIEMTRFPIPRDDWYKDTKG